MSGLIDFLVVLLQHLMPNRAVPGESLVGQTCPMCHICPQPLGICLFLWAALGLALLLILVLCIGPKREKCPDCGARNRKKAKYCRECGALLHEHEAAAMPPQPQRVAPLVYASGSFASAPPAAPEAPAAPTISCPRCGQVLPAEARFCGGCGLSFEILHRE